MMFLRYAVYRFFTMLLTLWVVSILVFAIINLPPGDYLSNQIAELRATGQAEGGRQGRISAHRICARPAFVGTIPDLGRLLAGSKRVFRD